MTDRVDSASGSLAIRAERGISLFANSLVSRGLQEAGTLATLGSDALLAAGDIFTAATKGDVNAVRLILANDPGKVNARDRGQATPLHWAARNGHARVSESLLRAKADICATTHVGNTPLHFAAIRGHLAVVRLLLLHGADVDAKTKQGNTPLHKAAWSGCTPVVELLLSWGADGNDQNEHNLTPEHWAVNNGHVAVIEVLCENEGRWWSPGMRCFAVKAKPGEQIEWATWKDRLRDRLREMLKDQEQDLETEWLDRYGMVPHWPRGKPEKVVDSMEFEQQLILHGIEPEKFPMTVESEAMLPSSEIVTDVGFWMQEVILLIAD